MSEGIKYESLVNAARKQMLDALKPLKLPAPLMPGFQGDTIKFRPFQPSRHAINAYDDEQLQQMAEVRALGEVLRGTCRETLDANGTAEFLDNVHKHFATRRAEIYESLKARYIIEHGVPEDTAREANAVDVAMDQASHTVDAMRYAILMQPKP